jgi:sugar O-acyltransferase (sialic acid O-acetyltransferase NeuD family)
VTHKKKLVIFGTATTAEVIHYYFSEDSDYEPVAFCANSEFIKTDSFLELPLLPFKEIEAKFSPKEHSFFCAVGQTELNSVRKSIYLKAKAMGYSIASYVSSQAEIAKNATMGEHCFIDTIKIHPYSAIGDNCIICSDIEHHCKVKSDCFIARNASLGGMLIIGEQTFVGVNATIRDKIEIGSKNIIGAGSLILSNTKPNSVFIQQGTKPIKMDSESFVKFEMARRK